MALPTPPQLLDRDWLEREYVLNRRTTTDIADEVGCGPGCVGRWLHSHKLPVRPRGTPRKGEPVYEGPLTKDEIKATDRKKKRVPTLVLFKSRVKDVLLALQANEKGFLRSSLLALAATCEEWADRIPVPDHPVRS